MGARQLVVALAVGATVASLGCGSGDGVPKAAVRNGLDGCIVEAAWFDDAESVPYGLGYYWSDAILPGGQTATREMVEGKGFAYAVVVKAADCYQAATLPGGTLYKTKSTYQMQAGKTLIIPFTTDSAEPDNTPNDICRFCRLGCCTQTAPLPDAAAD